MNRKRIATRIFALSATVAVLGSAALAAGVEASPAWKANGVELTTSETTLGHAGASTLAIPSLTNTCEPFVYAMTISNSAGKGTGSITSVPLSNCFTNSPACEIASIKAEKTPWSAKLATVGVNNYLLVEGIKIGIFYKGEECVLGGLLVTITGTAGGVYDNETESVTFNSSTFKATKTQLKALGGSAEWAGIFTMLMTGAHMGESLTVS